MAVQVETHSLENIATVISYVEKELVTNKI